jgi:hypothetical protein
MTWMLTYTGATVDLQFGDPTAISILDIAAGLSKINRFNGHTRRVYSVAEHSLHVCHVMERDLQIREPRLLLAGLLHDAHEAYIGDLSTPMKQALTQISNASEAIDSWAAIEARAEFTVRCRFGVHTIAAQRHAVIRMADLIMLRTERDALLPPSGPAWPILDNIPAAIGVDLNACAGLTPDDWRDTFLERFADLRAGITLGRLPYVPKAAA